MLETRRPSSPRVDRPYFRSLLDDRNLPGTLAAPWVTQKRRSASYGASTAPHVVPRSMVRRPGTFQPIYFRLKAGQPPVLLAVGSYDWHFANRRLHSFPRACIPAVRRNGPTAGLCEPMHDSHAERVLHDHRQRAKTAHRDGALVAADGSAPPRHPLWPPGRSSLCHRRGMGVSAAYRECAVSLREIPRRGMWRARESTTPRDDNGTSQAEAGGKAGD